MDGVSVSLKLSRTIDQGDGFVTSSTSAEVRLPALPRTGDALEFAGVTYTVTAVTFQVERRDGGRSRAVVQAHASKS